MCVKHTSSHQQVKADTHFINDDKVVESDCVSSCSYIIYLFRFNLMGNKQAVESGGALVGS